MTVVSSKCAARRIISRGFPIPDMCSIATIITKDGVFEVARIVGHVFGIPVFDKFLHLRVGIVLIPAAFAVAVHVTYMFFIGRIFIDVVIKDTTTDACVIVVVVEAAIAIFVWRTIVE